MAWLATAGYDQRLNHVPGNGALYPLTSTTGPAFMRLYVMGFAAGVWWLQQQAQLPQPGWHWLAPPLAFALLAMATVQSPFVRTARRTLAVGCCLICGALWAAWLAGLRLADELPAVWEGEDIQLVGVIAAMPQPYERSVRFEFDVERVSTPQAIVPTHLAISWWGTPERAGQRGG